MTIDGHTFNTTQLKLSGHGATCHRDYSAHFFRWAFVRRHVAAGAKVLDVGCGQELPLFKILTSGLGKYRPVSYTGVDLNAVRPRPESSNIDVTILDRFKVLTDHAAMVDHGYDVVTCLEVIEHMGHDDGRRLLAVLRDKLAPGGRLYLSTPVFNGSAAKNHVHEYTVEELLEDLAAVGLTLRARFGTFINLTDLRRSSMAHFASLLSSYFDDDAVSCICAPLVDANLARNNLWVLERR